VLAMVGAPDTAFEGYQLQDDQPAPGQVVGSFFLTDDGVVSGPPKPLILTLTKPVVGFSGDILDIDGQEAWLIQARNSNGDTIDTIQLNAVSTNAGNGLATHWSFLHATPDIASIRIAYNGGVTSNIGFAFDNFAPTIESSAYAYDVEAVDADNDPLTY